VVRCADLGDDLMGEWDPDTMTVWLHRDLSAAQLRCTLAHELVHAMRGDERCRDGVLDARQEAAVRRLTARLLIPVPRLAAALAWTHDEHELAAELHVDLDTLHARREHLTAAERTELLDLIARTERAA
jgi:Zn-dependent peptidase ImmA (M78 family)